MKIVLMKVNVEYNKKFMMTFLLIYSIISKLLTSFHSIIYDKSLYYQDGAIFINVGRMIMEGKVLYKETFDHKTPYIYFIYGFASLLKDHLGLYLIEVALLFIILLFIYKTIKLFDYKYSLIVTLLLSLFLNSQNFTQGFFKTETCALAVFAPAIYLFSKFFISNENKFKLVNMLFIGIFAGFSFMVNIRAVVLFVPFAVMVAFKLIKYKEFLNLILVILVGILGVVVSICPYFVYVIYTDSLYDFLHAVVYTNLAYTKTISITFANRMESIYLFLQRDTFFVIYALYSFIAILFIKFNKYLKAAVIVSYFFALYYILFTGKNYLYYFVIIVPYFSFGIILVINVFEKYLKKICYIEENCNAKVVLVALILILISFITSFKTINIMNKNCIRRSEKLNAIFKNANIDYKSKKLLAIGFQPMVYTNLDIIPKYKYFFTPDVNHRLCPEPFKGQVEYVMNLDPDIIVLNTPLKSEDIVMVNDFSVQDCYRMRECIRSNYSMIATYDMDEVWGTYKIYIKNNKYYLN